MIDYDRILRNDEKAVYRLRELFGNYGYRRFKTGKFEEYELYAENKDFLGEDGILTFTDARGKLMALKPDVVHRQDGGTLAGRGAEILLR